MEKWKASDYFADNRGIVPMKGMFLYRPMGDGCTEYRYINSVQERGLRPRKYLVTVAIDDEELYDHLDSSEMEVTGDGLEKNVVRDLQEYFLRKRVIYADEPHPMEEFEGLFFTHDVTEIPCE
jgi:hypothetical protein